MSVTRKEFETGKETNLMLFGARQFELLRFLKLNKNTAFTIKEVSEQTSTKKANVYNTFRVLVKKKKVIKKGRYYIINLRSVD